MTQRVAMPVNRVGSIDSSNHIWPARSRRVAKSITRKYGPAHQSLDSMLIWCYNGDWKRTVVHKDGVLHNFPKLHRDLLEQTIEYKVPAEKCSELSAFNGSLVVDRTRGEMTAFCANEGMNRLILNLANEIVVGRRKVEDARSVMAGRLGTLRLRWHEPYTERFLFTTGVYARQLEDSVIGDPDRPIHK